MTTKTENKYKIVNGTAYHIETPQDVINIIERQLSNKREQRIRVFYGDNKNGQDWNEVNDIIGYIGRSTGNIKIPLLVRNKLSSGGGALLDHCIVKITIDKNTVYQHPNYNCGELTKAAINNKELLEKGYKYAVLKDKKTIANFTTEEKANNYILFLQGKRNKI